MITMTITAPPTDSIMIRVVLSGGIPVSVVVVVVVVEVVVVDEVEVFAEPVMLVGDVPPPEDRLGAIGYHIDRVTESLQSGAHRIL